jgi:hypothetical protein
MVDTSPSHHPKFKLTSASEPRLEGRLMMLNNLIAFVVVAVVFATYKYVSPIGIVLGVAVVIVWRSMAWLCRHRPFSAMFIVAFVRGLFWRRW